MRKWKKGIGSIMCNKRYLYIGLLCCAIASCKNKTVSNGNVENNKAGEPVALSLLLADSIKIYYDISTETGTQQEINNEKVSNDNKIEMGIVYSLKKDTGNGYYFSMKYDKFRLHINTPQVEKELDAATANTAFSPSEKVFGVFSGATLQGRVSSGGTVTSITGVKEMTDRMYAIAGTDAAAKEMVTTSVKQYVSETFFKSIAEQTFKIYPPNAVKTGDTWEVTSTIQSEMNIPVKAVYTLTSVKDGIATINLQSGIKLEDQQMEVQGARVTADLEGEQSGEMQIDISTGLLRTGSSSLKIKGALLVMGVKVPVTINTSSRITSRMLTQ
jgi:Family of unknown function (DUF6263)